MTVPTIIGLSGPSSSGKTSIAHLLEHVFAPAPVHLIHADDFCRDFEDIPLHANGYLDCDGPDAVDLDRLDDVLGYMSLHEGAMPKDFKGWQEDVFPEAGDKALETVDEEAIKRLQEEVRSSGIDLENKRLVVVDGFLLYHNEKVRERLDAKLFLRLSRRVAKERRFNRPGYGEEAKKGEFWKTERYFDTMVWRSYVEQHAVLFKDGNVDGEVDQDVCARLGISVSPGLDTPMVENLVWTVREVVKVLE